MSRNQSNVGKKVNKVRGPAHPKISNIWDKADLGKRDINGYKIIEEDGLITVTGPGTDYSFEANKIACFITAISGKKYLAIVADDENRTAYIFGDNIYGKKNIYITTHSAWLKFNSPRSEPAPVPVPVAMPSFNASPIPTITFESLGSAFDPPKPRKSEEINDLYSTSTDNISTPINWADIEDTRDESVKEESSISVEANARPNSKDSSTSSDQSARDPNRIKVIPYKPEHECILNHQYAKVGKNCAVITKRGNVVYVCAEFLYAALTLFLIEFHCDRLVINKITGGGLRSVTLRNGERIGEEVNPYIHIGNSISVTRGDGGKNVVPTLGYLRRVIPFIAFE
jgi:hypothetical protein